MSIGLVKNKSINFLVAFTVVCNTGFAFAGSTPAPAPAPAPTQVCSAGGPGTTLEINPQTMEDLLFKRSLDIQLELETLYSAKANANLFATKLLPSLNLSLGSMLNPISFAVSVISFLVPFLIPSNYFYLAEANDQYKAAGQGYYITKLNELASIEGLYYDLIANLDTLTAVNEQLQMSEDTYSLVQAQVNLGLATQADLKQAQDSLDDSNARVAATQQAITTQNIAISTMLCYDPMTQLKIDVQHETPSSYEGQTVDQIDAAVITTSPEWIQMSDMIAAAGENTKATKWSWINTGTLAANGSGGGSASFDKMSAGLSFQIGPQLIPQIDIAQIAAETAKTQQEQVEDDMANTIGSTLAGLTGAVAQLASYQDAENSSRYVYQTFLTKYQTGATDLTHVFLAQTQVITDEMNRIMAQNNVDTERVALKRLTREGDFAGVKQCNLDGLGTTHKGWFKKAGGIFASPQLSVDQACANTQQEPNIANPNGGKK